MRYLLAFILPLITGAMGANHVVTVAPSGTITYSPTSISAAMGDTVEFEFASNNHSVAQADFASPCQPSNGGIWSGFVLTTGGSSLASTTSSSGGQVAGYKRQSNTPSFTISVNSTDPVFFYCAQIGHCQAGMVFALNPSGNETFAAFKAAASNSNTVVPTKVEGGTLSGSSTSGSSSTTTSASVSSPTSLGNLNAVSVTAVFGVAWVMAIMLS